MLQILFISLFRLRVYGRENVQRSGSVVIASNHQSFLDPMLVGVGLPRSLNYMSRDSLFRFPPFRWLIRSLNAFPFMREGIDTTTVREAIRRVSEGGALLVFPEGTRTRDGKISKIKKGTGLISLRAKAPIVPVVIDGAFEAWPRHQLVCRPHPIKVAFGPPIPYAEQATASGQEMARVISDRMAALQRFLFEKKNLKRKAVRRRSGLRGGNVS